MMNLKPRSLTSYEVQPSHQILPASIKNSVFLTKEEENYEQEIRRLKNNNAALKTQIEMTRKQKQLIKCDFALLVQYQQVQIQSKSLEVQLETYKNKIEHLEKMIEEDCRWNGEWQEQQEQQQKEYVRRIQQELFEKQHLLKECQLEITNIKTNVKEFQNMVNQCLNYQQQGTLKELCQNMDQDQNYTPIKNLYQVERFQRNKNRQCDLNNYRKNQLSNRHRLLKKKNFN